MTTIAEVLAYRDLEDGEQPSAYATGQHGARMWGPKTANLTYVDVNGWLIIMPCALDDHEQWYPMGRCLRVDKIGHIEVYPISPDFELSLTMREHLAASYRRMERKKKG